MEPDMGRSPRELYVDALHSLLCGRMAAAVRARDWELLREVARLAEQDAPLNLAATDPALFRSWRAAVTKFHVAGWTNMTPDRVDQVRAHEMPTDHISGSEEVRRYDPRNGRPPAP
jgi:hypothetical protein